MKRRDFLTTAAAAGIAAHASHPAAAEQAKRQPLPSMQSRPAPDLGLHWPTFEKLSADCQPTFSYLNDEFDDPKEWTRHARSILKDAFHYQPAACDPAPELIERVDVGAYFRERVVISTTPHIRIPVYVLVPKHREGPAPALVALHDHGGVYFWGKEKVVSVPPTRPQKQKVWICVSRQRRHRISVFIDDSGESDIRLEPYRLAQYWLKDIRLPKES